MRHLAVAVCLSFVALTASGATFESFSEEQLLARADVVVIATVTGSQARQGEDRMIYTDARLSVEQVLKGSTAASIVVSEAGGFLNGKGVAIPGAPAYHPGSRVLTFLKRRDDGSYYTASMALGKYRFEGELLVRDLDGVELLNGEMSDTRDALAYIAAVRSGRFENAPKVASHAREPKVSANAAASAYVLYSQAAPQVLPLRWKNGGSIGFTINQVQPGVDTTQGLDDAFDAWSGGTGITVLLDPVSIGGDTNHTNDDEHDIVLGWNGSSPHPMCEGSLGCGIAYYNGFNEKHTFRGEEFYDIVSADVIIHQSVTSQTLFEGVLTHELGHALGFRHSNAGTPSGSGIMNSSVPANMGANLGPWDLEALSAVYGPGVGCTNVSAVTVSGGGTVAHGASATLTASASGSTPFTYQWYEGPSGNTTNPVGGPTNSPNFTTPAITEPKQYWVKVSNSCPSSAASAAVSVTPAACNAAVITDDPDSQTIAVGASATLNAAGNGTNPVTWQWYRSNGATWTPVGTNSPSYNTGPLTTTTNFKVQMSNACGSDESAVATVTVGNTPPPCTAPAITAQPSTVNLTLGQGTTIAVSASGTAPVTYQWFRGAAPNDADPIAGATSSSLAAGPFTTAGTYRFWVRATNACGNAPSQTIIINVACPAISVPQISAPALTHFSTAYSVSWTGDVNVTPTFELQEATDAAFTQNVKTFTVSGALSRVIPAHNEVTTETRFYYRVRAISACTGQPTAYSPAASTVVQPPLPPDSSDFAISIPLGSKTSFTQDLLVPGFGESANNGDRFDISTDVPWLTVFPASGALSAGGTTVQLTINPTPLEVGSTTATIQITRTPGTTAGIGTNDGPVTTFSPFSVTMVTPVSPDPRDSNPPPGTLIIPAVAHAQGIGSPFRSDVRLVNVSFDDIEYEITYTPSGTDGTQQGKKTHLTVSAGDTVAFDDIVKSWYGAGVLGESGLGTIEIRPLNAPSATSTFASSRTYALDAGGTLGQFIPALRVDQFVRDINADTLGRISLQQVANSPFYRTNLGFVEGSGQPVQFRARLLDGNGLVLQTVTRDLPPFGHLQRNLTDLFGPVNLTDGRVEVEVLSSTGLVSAYASVLNNLTNDPLMVFPVQPARTTAGRYVLAGIAEFVAGDRNFHSDMRVYNAGREPVTVTLWYYDRGQSDPGQPPRQVTLAPGQVQSYNDVLPALWPGLVGGGSIVATAPPESSLVLTAQTYSRQPDGGTKGQFIPGVTFREATGLGERALEVLQLEQSAQYRSNVGVVEVTGKPAVIELTMYEPDAKVSASTQYSLKANEYIQFDRILQALGNLGTVYNGRVSVRVIAGEGRVYAYGSTVDNRTEDPTYVPAQ